MQLYNTIITISIIIAILSCIIATYTDIKKEIIPDALTVSIGIIGILFTSVYYYLINQFNILYYFSILFIFLLTYALWYFGVWAGGDVKLFTALSTLVIPENMLLIPKYQINNLVLPVFSYKFFIPVLLIIFNSILVILPLIIVIISFIVIKKKPYLKKQLKKELFNYKKTFKALNSLLIAYIITKNIPLQDIILKIFTISIISIITMYILNKNEKIIIPLTIIVFSYELLTNDLLILIYDYIIIRFTIIITNLFKSNIIHEALTDGYSILNLKEGMIPAYDLCENKGKFYLDKSNSITKVKTTLNKKVSNVVISKKACGLTNDDIKKLKKLYINGKINDEYSIKRGLPFAPFILLGLILTLCFGDTYMIFTHIIGVILNAI